MMDIKNVATSPSISSCLSDCIQYTIRTWQNLDCDLLLDTKSTIAALWLTNYHVMVALVANHLQFHLQL